MRTLLKSLFLLLNFWLLSTAAYTQLVVDFEALDGDTKGCAPEIINFTNLSTYNGAPIVPSDFTYMWNLGNGSTPSNYEPGSTYATVGNFNVSLTVTHKTTGETKTLSKSNYISISGKPSAGFSANITQGCKGVQVCFTDESTSSGNSISNWNWSFGDGQVSSTKNPCVTYNTLGQKTVFFKVTDDAGCFDSETKVAYINILDLDSNFSVNPAGACLPPLDVALNSVETGPYVYSWQTSNGLTSSGNSTNILFPSSGSFDITLNIKGPANCFVSKTIEDAVVISNPVADFTIPSKLCLGTNYKPTNTSTGAVTYEWQFDGKTAFGFAPNISFSAPGSYTIKLIAYGPGKACFDEKTVQVTVEDFQADFDLGQDFICNLPTTVTNTYTGDPAVNYTWLFHDDSTYETTANPDHEYEFTPQRTGLLNNGFYDVTLTAESANGCISTITKTVEFEQLVPSFDVDTFSGCVPLEINFTNTTTFSRGYNSISWVVKDEGGTVVASGTGPVFMQNFTIDGDYTVVMSYESAEGGCVLEAQTIIEAGILPTIDNDPLYPFDTCAFAATIGIDRSYVKVPGDDLADSFNWAFGRTTPDGRFVLIEPALDGKNVNIINKIDTGLFTMRRIVGYNGCFDTTYTEKYMYKKGPIIRGISRFKDCSTSIVNFNLAINVAADSVEWQIDPSIFSNGDDIPVSETDPRTLFISQDSLAYDFAPGFYKISVFADDETTGCFYRDSIFIEMPDFNPLVDPTHIAPPKCPGDEGTYKYVELGSLDARKVRWVLNADTLDFDSIFEYTFVTPGTYDFEVYFYYDTCLIVRTFQEIVGGPDLSIILDNPDGIYCVGEEADFNAVVNNGVNIKSWFWNVTNSPFGTFSAQDPPPFIYTTEGTQPVTLIASDNNGCVFTTTVVPNVIAPKVKLNLLKDEYCSGSTMQVENNTLSNRKLDYEWFVDGVSVSTDSLPIYLVNGRGRDVKIKLEGTTTSGCYGADSSLFDYDPNPVLDFAAANRNVCPEFEVSFEQDYTLFDTTGTTWFWDFGNTITSTFQEGKSIYFANGLYTVRLAATTELGCTDTITKVDYINVSYPEADFEVDKDTICINEEVTFTVTKLIDVTEFEWDYDDGFTEDGTLAQDTYVHPYTSKVGMIYPRMVIRVDGCADLLITDSLYVYDLLADYTVSDDSLCGPGDIVFTDASTGATSYTWDFGSGPELPNTPTVTKSLPIGTYDTYLAVESTISGCKDTAFKTINVFPELTATVDPVDNPLCPGDVAQLNVNGGVTFLWSPAAGLSNTTIPNPKASPLATTTYNVNITDTNGCTDTKTVQVIRDKTSLDVPLEDTASCGSYVLDIPLAANNSNGTSHVWDFGDGTSFTGKNPNHVYNSEGVFTVTYSVFDLDAKCTLDSSFTVEILEKPEINMPGDTIICKGDNFQILATGNGNANWTPNPSGEAVASVVAPVVAPNYDTEYTLILSLPNKCADTNSVVIGVDNPKANFSVSPTSSCEGADIFINNVSSGDNFFWDFGDGTTTLEQDPTHVFNTAGIYTVVLEVYERNKLCTRTASEEVIVNTKPDVRLADDTLICIGTYLQLQAHGGETYTWEPKAAFDDPFAANPVVRPLKDIQYTVIVVNEFACTQVETIDVTVADTIEYTAPFDTTIIIGESVGYNINPDRDDINFRIEPEMYGGCSDCFAPYYYRPTEDQCYTLYISDQYLCTNDTVPYCIYIDERYTLDVPSAFTPNDDNNNDKIYVRGYGIDYLINFTIYNRWGEVVFQTEELSEGWDGSYKAKEQMDETFVYRAQAKMLNGTTQEKNGYITIIR